MMHTPLLLLPKLFFLSLFVLQVKLRQLLHKGKSFSMKTYLSFFFHILLFNLSRLLRLLRNLIHLLIETKTDTLNLQFDFIILEFLIEVPLNSRLRLYALVSIEKHRRYLVKQLINILQLIQLNLSYVNHLINTSPSNLSWSPKIHLRLPLYENLCKPIFCPAEY